MSSLVKDYIEKSGEMYLNPENTKVGDLVEVLTVVLDSTTFEKPYIMVTGILQRTDEDCNVRLGVQNLKRIVEDLGYNEKEWIGHNLRVLAFQEYAGLNKKGIIWGGKRLEKLDLAGMNPRR